MLVTYGQLRASAPHLTQFSAASLRAPVAIKVARTLRSVQRELELLEERRLALIKKHGGYKQKQDDVNFSFPEGAKEAFEAEWRETLDTQIDLQGSCISASEIPDLQLTANFVGMLLWMIEE